MTHLRGFLRLVVGLLFVTNLALSTLGCSLTLGQQYPQARIWNVCAVPEAMELQDDRTWLYAPDGTLIPRSNTIGFERLASKVNDIFVFDLEASKDSPSALPSPDNQLACQTGFSWLNPKEVEDAPITGCRVDCQLPDSSAVFAGFAPCPLGNLRQEVSFFDDLGRERPDVRLLGQTEAAVRSGFLQPLPGVAYAPDCQKLVRETQKRQAAQLGEQIGRDFGRAIGDYDASFSSVGVMDSQRRYEILRSYPIAFETLQLDLAAKLNAIPELPTYEDPEIALAAQMGFETGYGAGIEEARRRALAIDLAWMALHAVCGNVACAIETVGARVLQSAITRLRAMPIFIPGSVNGAGFFLRVRKAPPTATGTAGEVFVENRAPAPMPAARPHAPAAPPTPQQVVTKTVPRTNPSPGTNAPQTNSTPTTTTLPQTTPSGQLHHGISDKVFTALERHKNLKGKFKLRDPRFTARAADKEAHNGYQDWHRDLDKEVVNEINKNQNFDVKSFTAWLYKRYSQSDLARRFPGGLGENK